MFCPECGSEAGQGQKFCESCGAPLKISVPDTSEQQFSAGEMQSDYSQQMSTPAMEDSFLSPQSKNAYDGNSSYQNMSDNSFSQGTSSTHGGDFSQSTTSAYSGDFSQSTSSAYGSGFSQGTSSGYGGGSSQGTSSSYGSGFSQDSTPSAYGNSSFSSGTPVQQSYSGTMPITNGSRIYDSAPVKKKSPKKAIIITLVILLVAVLGLLAFFFIRKKIERDFIINNPTKSAALSYKKYMEVNNSDDPIYSVLKNANKNGTLSVNATGRLKSDGSSTDLDINAVLGYDRPKGRYYFKLDGGDLLTIPNAQSQQKNNAVAELSMSPDMLIMNYDIAGSAGKYYIDNKNFRNDIGSSIFAFDKDNLFHFADKDAYEKFIDSYETMINELPAKENEDDLYKNDTYDGFIKAIEKHGKVTVEDGTAVVNDGKKNTEYKADVIIYTFNKESFKSLIKDLKEELDVYIDKTGKPSSNKDLKESVNKSMDEALKSFDSSAGSDFSLSVKVYLDRDDHSLLKMTADFSDTENQNKLKLNMSVDMVKAPDSMMRFTMTAKKNDEVNSASASLVKIDKEDTLKYEFTYNVKTYGSEEDNKGYINLDYSRKTKKFTLSGDFGQEDARFTYSGKADITDNSISLSLDNVVDNEYMQLSLKADFKTSAPPSISSDGAVNVLKMSKKDFEKVMNNSSLLSLILGSAYPQSGGYQDKLTPPTAYYDDDYDDYDDYDSSYPFDMDDYDFSMPDLDDYDISIPDLDDYSYSFDDIPKVSLPEKTL